jgi:hypothetical protein
MRPPCPRSPIGHRLSASHPGRPARREVRRAGAKFLQTGEAGRRQAQCPRSAPRSRCPARQRTAFASAVRMRVSTATTTKVSMSCATRGRSTAPNVWVSEFFAGGVQRGQMAAALPTPAGQAAPTHSREAAAVGRAPAPARAALPVRADQCSRTARSLIHSFHRFHSGLH